MYIMILRAKLEKKLSPALDVVATHVKISNEINTTLLNSHNMDAGNSNAYIMGMKKLSSASIEELYWITNACIVVLEETEYNNIVKEIKLSDYFGEVEIQTFSKSRVINKKKSLYPLEFDVMKIGEDQWISVFNLDFLKELYDAQLIRYNKNTQRNTKKKITNGHTTFVINTNETSVTQIENLLLKEKFISNTLTLNLNADNPSVDFDYVNGKIILYGGQFDIIDGFHRFKAAMNAKHKKQDLSFNFSVNIMNFNEDKARVFVGQEYKRNRIDKNLVRSFDVDNLSNLVVQRLTQDSGSYLHEIAGRDDSFGVNATYLFGLIDYCFSYKRRNEVIPVVKYLKEIFNNLIEENEEYTIKIPKVHLAVIIRCASHYFNENDNTQKAIKNSNDILKKCDSLDIKKFERTTINKALFKEIDGMIGGF